MPRKFTRSVQIGPITVGGAAPIVVQSMTNTDTEDAIRTVAQIADLARAGSEIVRITVNTEAAANAVPEIRDRLVSMGIDVPLVGDFHFNGHKLLSAVPDCASALAKYRINPGNVGRGSKRDEQFAQMIEIAARNDKPVRIGANWGSLDQDLLAKMLDENASSSNPKPLDQINRDAVIKSALDSAEKAVELGLGKDKIILSCKMSRVQDLVSVYQSLASQTDFALHLGLTEAGMGSKGIVASTAALAVLLQQGIGDTIRISLTPEPACPGCGRTSSTYFQELASRIQTYLRDSMPGWKDKHPGVADMSVAVMGCVVNGPGESKHANIGISLPGTGERPIAPVYIDGEKAMTLKGDYIAEEFQDIVNTYVESHYAK